MKLTVYDNNKRKKNLHMFCFKQYEIRFMLMKNLFSKCFTFLLNSNILEVDCQSYV